MTTYEDQLREFRESLINFASEKEALLIAHQWALEFQAEGKEVTKDTFTEYVRGSLCCTYLKDNSDAIWEKLSALIS
jgi:hypothetical protein